MRSAEVVLCEVSAALVRLYNHVSFSCRQVRPVEL
jgi:hypothetical protein